MAHSPGDRKGVKNHAAFNKTVFYEFMPTIAAPKIIDINTWRFDKAALFNSFENKVLRGLYLESKFQQNYTYAGIRLKKSHLNEALVGWFSKEFFHSLEKNDELVVLRLVN